MQDDAAAAAVELEPQGAAFVPLEALPAGSSRPGRAGSVSAGLRECGVRPAGRPPAVVFHPVRDRVAGAGGLVARPAEPLSDRGGELLLLGGVVGGVPLENWIRPLACGFAVALGGSAVLVDQPVQYRFSADSLGTEVDCRDAGSLAVTAGNPLGDALMWPGRVVVDLVLGQDGAQVRLAEDQHAVEELAAQGAEEAFAGRVHPGSLDGGPHDPGAGGLEDGVEGPGEVRSAVADQEPEALGPLPEGKDEVAGLLHGPLAGGIRGDAAQVHPAGAVLDEHQDVQPFQQHGVHVEEINGQDPGGLGVQELPPGRARAARRRIDVRSPQDFIDGGRGDRDAELGQLAVDPAVAPQRVLLRQADGEATDTRDRRRAAGLAPLARVVLPGSQPAVLGQQCRWRHGEDR